jgi:hypothetical protein
MEEIPLLSLTLPDLWAVTYELKAELDSGRCEDWESLYKRLDFLIEQEWIEAVETVIPGWEKISTQKDGLTAKHTMLVLVCCMSLPEYQAASTQIQYEIEWAAVFHDLDKDVHYGRGDGSHGFRSAGVAAQRLADLGFDFRPDGDFAAWVDLVKSSQKQVDGKWINDFSHLPDILTGLRYFFGDNSSASHIFKAVMFHQSLPTLEDWPSPIILSDDEIRAYLTLDDMDVLGPLMLGDSAAWNLCNPMMNEYMAELRGNIAKVKNLLSP